MTPSLYSTVLLIDTNDIIGGVIAQRLEQEGFAVQNTIDAKEGLRQMIAQRPIVVLLDIPDAQRKIFFKVLRDLVSQGIPSPPNFIVLGDVITQEESAANADLNIRAYLLRAATNVDEIILKLKAVFSPSVPAAPVSEVQSQPQPPPPPVPPPAPVEPPPTFKRAATQTIQSGISESRRLKAEIDQALRSQSHQIQIVPIVDNLIAYAYLARVSDIHIKPELDKVLLRFRVDGLLQNVFSFPKSIQSEVISRIKVLAGLRTYGNPAGPDGGV